LKLTFEPYTGQPRAVNCQQAIKFTLATTKKAARIAAAHNNARAAHWHRHQR
jgi:hypothetical protein